MIFNKMYANGTVINNCLSKETIKEYFPKPRASKTPDIKTPKDETIKRLQEENLYLKAELEYSKKLRAVVQARKNQQQKKK